MAAHPEVSMGTRTETPATEPTREEIDQLEGPAVLEFGASWCGHCQALAPRLDALLDDFPAVRHIWIEDGPGQPLGRSFRVKLWPTLVFLRDGQPMGQVSRPDPEQVRTGLEAITSGERHATPG
jgi:thioredoxin 1